MDAFRESVKTKDELIIRFWKEAENEKRERQTFNTLDIGIYFISLLGFFFFKKFLKFC